MHVPLRILGERYVNNKDLTKRLCKCGHSLGHRHRVFDSQSTKLDFSFHSCLLSFFFVFFVYILTILAFGHPSFFSPLSGLVLSRNRRVLLFNVFLQQTYKTKFVIQNNFYSSVVFIRWLRGKHNIKSRTGKNWKQWHFLKLFHLDLIYFISWFIFWIATIFSEFQIKLSPNKRINFLALLLIQSFFQYNKMIRCHINLESWWLISLKYSA